VLNETIHPQLDDRMCPCAVGTLLRIVSLSTNSCTGFFMGGCYDTTRAE